MTLLPCKSDRTSTSAPVHAGPELPAPVSRNAEGCFQSPLLGVAQLVQLRLPLLGLHTHRRTYPTW
jgi:hypothetical protein